MIKPIVLSVTLFLALAATSLAQSQYSITTEPNGTKILKGIISKELIAQDTSFAWYSPNQKNFVPNKEAVTAFKNKGSQLQLVIFGGTWCDDTKNLWPKFFSFLEAANFPQERVTVVGVDRNKKTIGHLAEAFNIINVPTFIVLKEGKEIGRVVEYGKYAAPDKELGELVNGLK
jgi:thiol-disulfide isomerase/thioredoxin